MSVQTTADPATAQPAVAGRSVVSFDTHPDRYRHWGIEIQGRVATLIMKVDEAGGIDPGYTLKLNSYDLGVDIELYDAVQRLRFEHPEVGAVIMTGAGDKVFCAGANIQMLAQSTHHRKVNFCKFTNETRLSIEDASSNSRQRYICALNGTASGGGYELALATDWLVLRDDVSSVVSLPEIPLLAVLPGTGGLTRLTDKRKVRRDLVDAFATKAEGVGGEQALKWNLVDQISPRSHFEADIQRVALAAAHGSDRPSDAKGIELRTLQPEVTDAAIRYSQVDASLDRVRRQVTISISGPSGAPPKSVDDAHVQGVDFWPLAVCRELDHLVLHLRLNEPELGTLVFKTAGDHEAVRTHDEFLLANQNDWFIREVILYWRRTLKRVDLTSRSLVALIEPGSCFTGTLLELALCADRSFILDEPEAAPPATLMATGMNFGHLAMSNGLTRLETRFLGDPDNVGQVKELVGQEISPADALEIGLVTFAPDDLDWEDEIRMALEERANLSPDALTGMEANLRFPGPETMETKIFARLTAWQNWIFQRPNASGADGALKNYGTGQRPALSMERV